MAVLGTHSHTLVPTLRYEYCAAPYEVIKFPEEYRNAGTSAFDRFVNGLNLLPRPIMALGTVGLFAFVMVEPEAFAARMVGLAEVPEPLWWLLGAIVGFYFGARELHYRRVPRAGSRRGSRRFLGRLRPRRRAVEDTDNPALDDWANARP